MNLSILFLLRCFFSLHSSQSSFTALKASPFDNSYCTPFPTAKMDTAIDLLDASKALDLANIRFQLMSVSSPAPKSYPAR
jgi:hypothetical protein